MGSGGLNPLLLTHVNYCIINVMINNEKTTHFLLYNIKII